MFSFLSLLAMIGAAFGFDAWQSGARGRGRSRRRVASGGPVPDHAPNPPLATPADAGAPGLDMPPGPDVIAGEDTLAAALLAGEWDAVGIPDKAAPDENPAALTTFDPTREVLVLLCEEGAASRADLHVTPADPDGIREVQVFGKPAIRLSGGAGPVDIGTDDVILVAAS